MVAHHCTMHKLDYLLITCLLRYSEKNAFYTFSHIFLNYIFIMLAERAMLMRIAERI